MEFQETYLQQLKHFFKENGMTCDQCQFERLAKFASFITEKNTYVNLISRKDINSIIENHIFISAYLNRFLPDKGSNFLDIGTGGGLPGIPFAIVRPAMKGVLVDSTSKKIIAVKEFIDKLKLGNVTTVNSRVESPEFIEKYNNFFDIIISRATVQLILLLRYSLPLMKEKSYLAAIKGGDLTDEIKQAELKYKVYIKKSTVFELAYKPSNIRNEKGKKLILMELNK